MEKICGSMSGIVSFSLAGERQVARQVEPSFALDINVAA
jgi:hypothetical protein